jgi:hypothetical protein
MSSVRRIRRSSPGVEDERFLHDFLGAIEVAELHERQCKPPRGDEVTSLQPEDRLPDGRSFFLSIRGERVCASLKGVEFVGHL